MPVNFKMAINTIPNIRAPYPATRRMHPVVFQMEKVATEVPPGLTDFLSPAQITQYLGPVQTLALFMAGVATSIAGGWFFRGLTLPKQWMNPKTLLQEFQAKVTKTAGVETEHQLGTVFTGNGIIDIAVLAMQHPELKKALLAYLGASALGYAGASLADGLKEVMVRKEETQIRANLLGSLTETFQNSLKKKGILDLQLREKAKARIREILTQCGIPQPENLLDPAPAWAVDESAMRYPYFPVHLSQPTAAAAFTGLRFGSETLQSVNTGQVLPLTASHLGGYKVGVFGLGALTGSVGQFLLKLSSLGAAKPIPKSSQVKLMSIFNVSGKEGLFVIGNKVLLVSVLAMVGFAKLGKMLIDAYREIEVTRRNADTERRYQQYNWGALDPHYHRLAEENALEKALQELQVALRYEYNNRPALASRIQTILSNIGRNSAPPYFLMTPPVSLVEARS